MPSQEQRNQDDSGSARRGPNPLACEMFQGINTVTTRSGVPDQQMFWCDGFIPLAPRNLRVLRGIGSALYTAVGTFVICFYFYNIGSTPYMVVFQSDGSVIQVRTTDGATTQILPGATANSIYSPSITSLGTAQYGSQYLIFVSNQTPSGNGYWIWDGSLLYANTIGTLAPQITLTNPGSAYQSQPAVLFSGGGGSGAAATATIAGGSVTNIQITNPGSGYTSPPSIVLQGGTLAGSGASLSANMTHQTGGSGGSISTTWSPLGSNADFLSAYSVGAPGSGYSSVTTAGWNSASLPGLWVNNGIPTIGLTISGGAITGVTITPASSNPQMTWLKNGGADPSVVITDNGTWVVSSISGPPTGTNYSPSTKITASGGQSPISQATLAPVISGGVITGVTVLNGGSYGGNSPAPTITATDTAVTATATCGIMPAGVQGNTVETYSGHVWVANGNKVQFTAPGSVADFASSDGGGLFTSSDSFLRVGYTRLLQTNGFLFLIGDSSMNYISGVQTNTPMGGNPTTTFTNNNCDPETGTPYPASVVTIGQDIFLANQNGIYVSSGGTFEKKSEMLDGVYNSAANVFGGAQLSAAKAVINGKLVWMVLVPIIDPVTKSNTNKIFMFNQKYWWSSEQDVQMQFIQSQEINSVFTPYGTDGVKVYPMFSQPSTGFTKRFQSRLWDAPAGYDHAKSSVRLFAMAQFIGASNQTYNIFVDNENGASNHAGPYVHSSTTNTDIEVTSVMPPTSIGQIGVLTGMTVTTTADDLVIVSVMMQDEIVGYRA